MGAQDVTRKHTSVEDLQTTWAVLVVYRDLALESNDFGRAVEYSHVIEDMATLIQASGGQLPAIPKEQ